MRKNGRLAINLLDEGGPDGVAPFNPIYQDDFDGFALDNEMLQSMKLCLMRS